MPKRLRPRTYPLPSAEKPIVEKKKPIKKKKKKKKY